MALLPVIFDDIELWATGYLREALDARWESYTGDVFVSNAIPDDPATGEPVREPLMVIVRRDGGFTSDHVLDHPRLGVDCWAQSKADATNLARLVAALLESSPGDENVKSCRMTGGPSRIADPSKQPRVYMTFELVALGSDLDLTS